MSGQAREGQVISFYFTLGLFISGL